MQGGKTPDPLKTDDSESAWVEAWQHYKQKLNNNQALAMNPKNKKNKYNINNKYVL